MVHMLNLYGAIIGFLAAIAWAVSAVWTVPSLSLGAGGQLQLNSDLVRWIQDSERARKIACWLNTIAAFLTALSAALLSWAAAVS